MASPKEKLAESLEALEALQKRGGAYYSTAAVELMRDILAAMKDSETYQEIVDKVIEASPGQVAEYKAGKEKLIDSAGRIERFNRKYKDYGKDKAAAKDAAAKA